MTKKDATQRVLDMRQRVNRSKTLVTEARIQVRTAEDQLTAADDAIRKLGLDPDRDLERQVIRLASNLNTDLENIEICLVEVEEILEGGK